MTGLLLVAVFLLPLQAARADDPPPARWHFTFRHDVQVSILFARRSVGDETRLFVSCGGGRFELVSRQDVSGNDSTESIRSLEAGETFERRLLLSDVSPACNPSRPHDACLVWKGVNGALTTVLSDFSSSGAPEIRKKAEGLVSDGMRMRLFTLAPVLPLVAEFGSYGGDFLALVWPDRFRRPQRLERGKRTKGCDFDAGFGFPCTEAEKEKERRRLADVPDRPR